MLELAIQQQPEPPGELLPDARLVWATSFGSPRASGERHSRLNDNSAHVANIQAPIAPTRQFCVHRRIQIYAKNTNDASHLNHIFNKK